MGKLGLIENYLSDFAQFCQGWTVANANPEHRKSYFFTEDGDMEALGLNSAEY